MPSRSPDRRLAVTRSAFLAARARRHSGGTHWCKQPAAPQRRGTPRSVARHNPILPAMCCQACKQVGRLSGRLPIFRSRSIVEGWGSRRHCGGTSPSAATAVAAAP
jgi:hypothetical protein